MATGPPGKTKAAPGPGPPWSGPPRWSPGAPAPTATALISSWTLREEEAQLEVPDSPRPALHPRPLPVLLPHPPSIPPNLRDTAPTLPPSPIGPSPTLTFPPGVLPAPHGSDASFRNPPRLALSPPRCLLGVVVLEGCPATALTWATLSRLRSCSCSLGRKSF